MAGKTALERALNLGKLRRGVVVLTVFTRHYLGKTKIKEGRHVQNKAQSRRNESNRAYRVFLPM